jgi:NADPH:quinone reductase-like Zn-dependent oxidoreductase
MAYHNILTLYAYVYVYVSDWKLSVYNWFGRTDRVPLGFDISGKAVKIGKNVKHIKEGDEVVCHVILHSYAYGYAYAYAYLDSSIALQPNAIAQSGRVQQPSVVIYVSTPL